jgi:CBS-domain-containing membrane protein
MTKDVLTINSECTVLEACETYSKNNIGCLVVKNNDVVVGIITERDIIQYLVISKGNLKETKIKEIMTPRLKTIHATSSVDKAAEIMKENQIKRLPVVKNNDIVGMITETDLSRTIPAFSETIDELTNLYTKSRESIDKIMDEWGEAITKLKSFSPPKKSIEDEKPPQIEV